MSPRAASPCCLLLFCAAAFAQQPQVYDTNVDYQLAWTDIDGVANGVVEPGERVRFTLSIAMTPPVNSAVTWNTVIGGDGSGVFRGLQSIWFDLIGDGAAEGEWTALSVDLLWDLMGPAGYGTPRNNGSVLADILAGQFPTNLHHITMNPVPEIWTGTWTPMSYDLRFVDFGIVIGSSNPNPLPSYVLVLDGQISVLVGTSAHTATPVSIPIVPAPGGAIAMTVAIAAWHIRDRRR